MNSLPSLLSALMDHVWQSTLFAAAVAALALLFRRSSASTRYWLWFSASIKFLVPFSLLSALGARLYTDALGRFGAHDGSAVDASTSGLYIVASVLNGATAPLSSGLDLPSSGVTGVASTTTDLTEIILPALAALWVLGSLAVVARWTVRWTRVQRILRDSRPMALDFIAPVQVSDSRLEPGIVGVFRPVLLLPTGIEQHLTPAQLQAVLAHEQCHVQRRDNLTASLHMLVEVAFWFHPLVWWLGARLIEERERACDEQVLRGGHSRESYAEAILRVCQHYVQPRLSSVSAVSGADLKKRMEGIMSNPLSGAVSRTRKLILAAAGGFVIAIPVAVGIITAPQVQAQAQGRETTAEYRSVYIQLAPPRTDMSFRGAFGWDFYREDATLKWLVSVAYGIPEPQVIDIRPTKDTKYDVLLEGPSSRSPETQKAMIRDVLKKHFGLVVQSAHREMDGYALLKGAGSPKLARGAGPSRSRGVSIGLNALTMTNIGLGPLTNHMSLILNAPVVDETGITGDFDYGLVWGRLRPESSGPVEQVDPTVLTTAVEEQLGLVLEKRRMTVEVLNIVSAKVPADVVTGEKRKPLVLSQSEADLLSGSWHGEVEPAAPLMKFTAVLRFAANEKGEVSGWFSLAGSTLDRPLTNIRFSGGTLFFQELGMGDEGFTGTVTQDAIRGVWKIENAAIPVTLRRGEPEIPAFALSAEASSALEGEWTGKQGAFTVGLEIRKDAKGRYSGYYENRDMQSRLQLSEVSLRGNRLVARTAMYDGEIQADLSGGSISGTIASLGGPPSGFTLSRQ